VGRASFDNNGSVSVALSPCVQSITSHVEKVHGWRAWKPALAEPIQQPKMIRLALSEEPRRSRLACGALDNWDSPMRNIVTVSTRRMNL